MQLREVFHLQFLRWLGREVKSSHYALKGGANLRFFFRSFRYSEDMDLDVCGVKKGVLLDTVMDILRSSSFQDSLKPFGIERVKPPDIARAKQTETTQRFKTHLITYAGEDLFTKIEFSRRGFKGEIIAEPVADAIIRPYKLPPLLIPHYIIGSAIEQKIKALSTRPAPQARDILDLFVLSSQYGQDEKCSAKISASVLKEAKERIFEIDFRQFKDTVLLYLADQDRKSYDNSGIWDEVKLRVIRFLEEIGGENG